MPFLRAAALFCVRLRFSACPQLHDRAHPLHVALRVHVANPGAQAFPPRLPYPVVYRVRQVEGRDRLWHGWLHPPDVRGYPPVISPRLPQIRLSSVLECFRRGPQLPLPFPSLEFGQRGLPFPRLVCLVLPLTRRPFCQELQQVLTP